MRYQLDPATNQTYVEADLAGDSGNATPDFEIVLSGLAPLTSANFAETPTQSSTDLANGAALTETKVQTPAGAPTEWAYTSVIGKSYSSPPSPLTLSPAAFSCWGPNRAQDRRLARRRAYLCGTDRGDNRRQSRGDQVRLRPRGRREPGKPKAQPGFAGRDCAAVD